MLGGAADGFRNVISGNGTVSPGGMFNHGVYIEEGTNNFLQNNYIGTTASGNAPLKNGGDGVYVRRAASENVIGDAENFGNVIAGNDGYGIYLESDDNIVRYNKIGKAASGAVLTNGSDWLYVLPQATGNITDPNDHN